MAVQQRDGEALWTQIRTDYSVSW